jgi:rod shape-determining protein MreD
MNRWTFQFFTPLLLFFLLLIDSQLSQLFSSFSDNALTPICHLFLIFLLYSVTKLRFSYLIILSLILGIIYDSYFIGVLGLASAIVPLIALFIYELQETVFLNRWTRLFTVIIIVFLFEAVIPLLETLFGLITINLVHFVAQQLAPTLALNIFLAFLLQGPLEKLYGIKKTEDGYRIS